MFDMFSIFLVTLAIVLTGNMLIQFWILKDKFFFLCIEMIQNEINSGKEIDQVKRTVNLFGMVSLINSDQAGTLLEQLDWIYA